MIEGPHAKKGQKILGLKEASFDALAIRKVTLVERSK